jgi:hypothetical protein
MDAARQMDCINAAGIAYAASPHSAPGERIMVNTTAALSTLRAKRSLSGLILQGTVERYLAIARDVLGPRARYEEAHR